MDAHDRSTSGVATIAAAIGEPARARMLYCLLDDRARTSTELALGVDVAAARASRRRFAFACLDWSERRAHVGGAVGAAMLACALRRRWVSRERDGRALTVTAAGARELRAKMGLQV